MDSKNRLSKTPYLALPCCLMLLISACQSPSAVTDYDINKDFSSITEFSQGPSQQGIKNDDLTDQRLTAAIARQLQAKGLSLSDNTQSGSHVVVSHFLTTHTKQNNPSFNIGFGTGRISSGSSVGVGVNTSIPVSGRETVEVRVTIDFHQQGKLVWRGYDTFDAKGSDSPQKRQQDIDAAVANILSQYPPGQKGE
ncbi:DUF4136 domain-containing protein [Thalassotalea mangrovi]|nr:DUF4136 domain-containing protein [Thalassotalea mangrovi]